MSHKKKIYTIIGIIACASALLVIIFGSQITKNLTGNLNNINPSVVNIPGTNRANDKNLNQNSDATFTALPLKQSCSAYFSGLKPANIIADFPFKPTLSYKDAAEKLAFWYRAPLASQVSTSMAVTMEDLIRISYLPQVDFTKQVNLFYSYFGLNLGNKNISGIISPQELNTVISKIINTINTYTKNINNVQITFNVVNDSLITITYDDFFPGKYGYNLGIDPGDNSMNAGTSFFDVKEPNLYMDAIKKVGIMDNPLVDLPFFRYKYLDSIDANGQSKMSGQQAIITLKLKEPLYDGRKYTLEIDPLLFDRSVKGKMNVDRFDMGNSTMSEMCFPPSKFEFSKVGASKVFNYNGGGNTALNGIVIEDDIWNSWNGVPLFAAAYSQDGRNIDIQPGQLKWSIVGAGNGTISYPEYPGIPGSKQALLHFNDLPGQITVKVEYNGFSDQKTLYYVGGNQI